MASISCNKRSFNGTPATDASPESFRGKADEKEKLPSNYEDDSACKKMEYLWDERILKTEYSTLPEVQPANPAVITFRANVSMDRQSDELPEERPKTIHRNGSVAKVEFVASKNSPFTGLWAGSKCNLVRLSVALPDTKDTSVPGSAFKMFVDGAASQNFVAMYTLDGQKNEFNFFKNEFSNVVPPPQSIAVKALSFAFERASPFPAGVFLQDISAVKTDGSKVSAPVFPYRIYLVPNPKFKAEFSSQSHDFRKDLTAIDAESLLYTVYAVIPKNVDDNDSAKMFSEISSDRYRQGAVEVGTFVTKSRFVNSKWADDKLFFKHQRFFNEPSKNPMWEKPGL